MEFVAYAAATLLVLALAYGALFIARRFQGPVPRAGLRFVSALSIGQRERLVVVDWDGKRMLLGVTAATITWLGETASPSATLVQPGDADCEDGPLADYAAAIRRVTAKAGGASLGVFSARAGLRSRSAGRAALQDSDQA